MHTCNVEPQPFPNITETPSLSLPEPWPHLVAELRQNPDLHRRGAPASSRCGALAPIALGIADSHYTELRDSFTEDTHSMLQHRAEHHRPPFTTILWTPLVAEPRHGWIAVVILPDLQSTGTSPLWTPVVASRRPALIKCETKASLDPRYRGDLRPTTLSILKYYPRCHLLIGHLDMPLFVRGDPARLAREIPHHFAKEQTLGTL